MIGESRHHGIKSLGRSISTAMAVAGVVGALLGGVAVRPAEAQPADNPAPNKTIIRFVGTGSLRELTDRLFHEYGKTLNQANSDQAAVLDYQRVESLGGNVESLVHGRDLMWSLGPVSSREIGNFRGRWLELAPEQYIVGARAVAVVVHERNSVQTLSIQQLQAIYAGKMADWKVLGGASKPIRRYGLNTIDPLTALFHQKVLPANQCGPIQRKKESEQVLESVAGDPQGIAFVDAVAAMGMGDRVKMLALGEGISAVSPNAQSIKDGSYPLSEALVLYVSSKASLAAKDMAQRFILTGHGDAIIRQQGYMPTLRTVGADVMSAFEKLYGPNIKKAKSTADSADDLALAGQIIQSARSMKLESELLTAMCQAAYDLAVRAEGGDTLAFEVLGIWSQKVPDKRFDTMLKRAELCERAYQSTQSPIDGEHLVQTLMRASDQGTEARRYSEALSTWRRAQVLAQEIHSPRLSVIRERRGAFEARYQSSQNAQVLAQKLIESPKDARLRHQMLLLQLLELDDPQEALRYVDTAGEEVLKTHLPLATEPVSKYTEETALKLAEWYVGLAEQADIGGKELMKARSVQCYQRFFELHLEREDPLAVRAMLGIQKMGGEASGVRPSNLGSKNQTIAPAPGSPPGKSPGNSLPGAPGGSSVAPPPLELVTDVKLAEYVAAHVEITRLTRREIDSARLITDLRSLARLSRLSMLEMHQAGNIKDLSPLSGLSQLTHVTLVGLELENLVALSSLSRLTYLDLQGGRKLWDLTPIGRLPGLQTLTLANCGQVSNLTPLSSLASLTQLNLSGCAKVQDLAPLEKLANSLSSLALSGTGISDVAPLAKMHKLKTLDLRRCPSISTDDINWLIAQLPNCRVLVDSR